MKARLLGGFQAQATSRCPPYFQAQAQASYAAGSPVPLPLPPDPPVLASILQAASSGAIEIERAVIPAVLGGIRGVCHAATVQRLHLNPPRRPVSRILAIRTPTQPS